MTVIASDGITIAADGRTITGHSEIARGSVRKIRIHRGKIFALSGMAALFDALVDWYSAGALPKDAPTIASDATWTLIVIDGGGPKLFTHRVPYEDRLTYPITFGCGCDYAMGAMLAGASPERAVEITCEKEAFCGGEIQVVNIAEALGLQPVREAAE